MAIEEMALDQLEARLGEISAEVASIETEERKLELMAELDKIEARKLELKKQAEQKAEERRAVAEGAGEIITEKIVEEDKRTMRTIEEFRNSPEYIDAYAEMIKTGKDEELRTLLTENVENGTIAVPEFVYDIIKTAWDNDEIMSLIPKTSVKGNLKVQFEISGTDAVIHTEGSGAIDEETLLEGIVTIVPANVKKWVSFSTEVMELRGELFLRYIYNELAHKIAKKMADQVVNLIASLPATATATSVSANQITANPAMDTVAQGIANLSDEASKPIIIMNKLTWSEFKRVAYANGYGADPFEGLKVVFNNKLKSYASASVGDVYMIVGDLSQGALANFPNGEGVTFLFDELTRKKEDLVEVLGREYVGLGLIADKSFTNVKKAQAAG